MEILFDEMTAKDVAERLRVRAEIDNYLNAIVLTVARMNGARPDDRVAMNREGTGVVVTPRIEPTPSEGVTPPAPLKGGQKAAK